jgi:NADPH-dependent 2,4-dienoyl-CoA reductase/sulfur reductase-like enzyme
MVTVAFQTLRLICVVVVAVTRINAHADAADADAATVWDVVVVGGGYAGLTAARRLVAKGHSVLVLEANNRCQNAAVSVERHAHRIRLSRKTPNSANP